MKKLFIFTSALILFISQANAIEFSAHGYYRVRFEYTHDLDLQRPNDGIVPNDPDNDSNDRFGSIAFAQQRFRLEPHIKLNDHISFHGQIDFLDNLLFGQSAISNLSIANPITGTIALPDANGAFGVLPTTGGDVLTGGGGNISVKRVYVDLLTSGGKFRIGRQPSHFGLGIFQNDGNDLEADFGDTFDRILYLAGLDVKGGKLFFGVAYDYAFENQRDPSVSGLDAAMGSNWRDTMQGGILLMYQTDDFEVGTFSAVRYRNGDENATTTTALDSTGTSVPAGIDGNTFLYIIDLYSKFNIAQDYRLAIEAVYVGGKIATGVAIDAVALDDPAQAGLTNPLPNPITLPLTGTTNDVSVFLAAVEASAEWDFGGEMNVKAGFASGDSAPLSQRVTQLGFRPDYDLGIMLFDVPLGTSPAVRVGGITEQGRKPMTPNYINNAIYASIQYKHTFDITSGIPWATDFKVGGQIITAFAPSRNLDIDFAEITGIGGLPHIVNASRWYGLEIDLSVEATFFEFMHWKTVVAALLPGGLFDIKNDDLVSNQSGIVNPILFDGADIGIATKTSLIFEF